MMNLAAICLVISALIGAEIWSPVSKQPVLTLEEQSPAGNDVVVKDGHRVVVVEYEQDGTPNTKITISPMTEHKEDGGFVDKAKEKIKQTAADVFPEVGQGISQPGIVSDDEERLHATAGELICDALGRCKHRIADAIGKTKDTVQEFGDRVGETAAGLEEAVQDVKDSSVHMAHEAEDRAAQKAHSFNEAVAQKAQHLKERIYLAEKVAAHTAQNVSNSLKTGLHKVITAAGRMVATTAKVMPSLSTLGRLVGMLGFSTAFGTCIWVTFVSSYVLEELRPRQQLGVVQSKIYPVYFWVMGWSIGMALFGHLLGQGNKLLRFPAADMIQGFNLLFGLLMVVVNAVFLEPRATKVMFERMKIEKEEGRGRPMFAADLGVDGGSETTPVRTGTSENMDHEWAVRARMAKLSDRLKKLNSKSSWLNILTLLSLTGYLVYIAQRLC